MKIKPLHAPFPQGKKLILNVMRIALLLFVSTTFAFTPMRGLSQKITVDSKADKALTVDEVFELIEEQTSYHFIYRSDMFKDAKGVIVKKRKSSIQDLLDKAFLESPIKFKISEGNNIILSENSTTDDSNNIDRQKITVEGTVTDENGNPLPGVNITVEGTSKGTQTDFDGEYSLEVEQGAELKFSYVGFQDQEIKVGKDDTIDVTMEEGSELEEVQIIGYASQKKRQVTSSVDEVKSEDLDRPMTNLNKGLQGTSANLNIDNVSGKAFDQPSINIRGATSVGQGGDALVIIDGVEGDLSMVNPRDVESVSVLKGPAASAEYGSRAAFGVLQITTKEGKEGKLSASVETNIGIKKPAYKPGFVSNGYTYLKHFNEAYKNGQGSTPTAINKTQEFSEGYLEEFKEHDEDPSLPAVETDDNGDYVYYANTDWYKELYSKRILDQEYNFTASGGGENAIFYLSGRYQGEDGLFKYNSNDYKMYNLRAKGDIKLASWLRLKNNFSLSKRKYFNPLNVGEGGGIWRNIQDEGHPSASMLNPDGSISFSGAYTVGDFLYGKNGKSFDNQVLNNQIQLQGNFFDDKLTLTGSFSYKNTRRKVSEKRVPVPYSKTKGSTNFVGKDQNNLALTNANTDYFTWNFVGTYANTLGENHNLDLTFGSNYENQTFDESYVKRNGLAFPNADNLNLALGQDFTTSGTYRSWTLFGLFYQFNYDFDGRYLITLSGRYDGNSRFPSNQRYEFFPSFSAGWFISEEPFWNVSSDLISGLKFRGSYGSLGNGNVAPYTYQEKLPISQSGNLIDGEKPASISKPDVLPSGLTWEKVSTSGVGLDLWMFNDRFSVNADYYIRKTTDMFTKAVTPPRVFGASTPNGNFADLKTKGWEVSVSWDDNIENVAGKELDYSIDLNVSNNKAKITKFNNPDKNLDDHYVGERIGEIWGYETGGIFQSDKEVKEHANQDRNLSPHTPDGKYREGYLKFKDLNDDGEINDGDNRADSPGDRRVIGNSEPRYRFGAQFKFEWNNFTLSAFFQGVGKRDWYPGSEADNFWGQYNRPYNQLPKWQLKDGMIWSPDNPDGFLPKYTGYEALEADLKEPQTRYLMNVAYIRLKNISIGYNFKSDKLSDIGIDEIGLTLSGENLWTYSPLQKYTRYIDPEVGTADSENDVSGGGAGDGLNYPMLRTLTLGVSVTF